MLNYNTSSQREFTSAHGEVLLAKIQNFKSQHKSLITSNHLAIGIGNRPDSSRYANQIRNYLVNKGFKVDEWGAFFSSDNNQPYVLMDSPDGAVMICV